jgi:ribonuclease HI
MRGIGMASAAAYYAVAHGLQNSKPVRGVFTNWEKEVQPIVFGVSGAVFKKFPTRAEAEAFLVKPTYGPGITYAPSLPAALSSQSNRTTDKSASSGGPYALSSKLDRRHHPYASSSHPVYHPSKKKSTSAFFPGICVIPENHIIVFVDGGAKPNPGFAACAAVIKDAKGIVIHTFNQYLGESVTINVAEYTGLLTALSWCKENGHEHIHVRMDSKLVVSQMNGSCETKDANMQALSVQCKSIISANAYPVDIKWIPRSQNSDADKLCNNVIDEHFCRFATQTQSDSAAKTEV